VLPILASIPSPSDNAIKIGGLELRAYGLAIALGVIAAVWIARRRWAARGGDPDDISRIALWAVLAGLIGARLYHVITDHDRFEGRWLHAFAVWEGGLGIPGGLIAGVGVGAFVAHRRGLPVAQLLDVVAPALPVAQAIGRLGNWFNQELFGRPTDLPWGLEIDPAHRPAGYLNVATFHPTFLYEAVWNLALAGGLVLWERHHPNSRPGRLFAFYVAGYAVGRAWVEALRIDPAAHLFGVRWNIWMSFIAFVGAVGWLVFDSRRARQEAEREPDEAAAEPADTEEPAAVGAAVSAEESAATETADEPVASETGEELAATEADESADVPGAAETSDAAADAESAEKPAATEVDETPEEPVAGDQADTTGAAGPEGQPGEVEVGAEEATTEKDDDAAEQPDAGEPDAAEAAGTAEPVDTAEQADAGEPDAAEAAGTAEPVDPAEQPDAGEPDAAEAAGTAEPVDPAEQPDAGEPDAAEAAGTAEPVDTAEQADAGDVDDAPDTSADTAATAQEPTNPAANDPDSDGANSPEPDAGQPTDAEAGHPTDPEPAPEAPPETADEEAAT
jgi:prolipoprotein diacylglyceryl transferase